MTAPVIHLASIRLVIGAVAASRWFANVRSDAVREQKARAIARRAMRAAYDAQHLGLWFGKGIE